MLLQFRPTKIVQIVFTALVFVALSGLVKAQDVPDRLAMETLTIQSDGGEHVFQVEVAKTDRERARGLMFREAMAADHGMLFIFESEGERFFWMKNTPLSLDIIYANGAGKIVSIAEDTLPYSERVIPSNYPSRFVLELNAGTSKKLGIKPGDVMASPSITDAKP